jgi:phage baseplate assembly protein W
MIFYDDIDNNGNYIVNIDAIKNYIGNILTTRVGSLPFKREFGSYLEDYLFEIPTKLTENKIKLEIYRALSKWLKDIEIKEIQTEFNELTQEYKVYIEFNIDKLNNTGVFETTLKRIT